jgi:hypothetical protein
MSELFGYVVPSVGSWVVGRTSDDRLVTIKVIKYYMGVAVVGMTMSGNIESVTEETAVVVSTGAHVGLVTV